MRRRSLPTYQIDIHRIKDICIQPPECYVFRKWRDTAFRWISQIARACTYMQPAAQSCPMFLRWACLLREVYVNVLRRGAEGPEIARLT
jgi:hypothetical protein